MAPLDRQVRNRASQSAAPPAWQQKEPPADRPVYPRQLQIWVESLRRKRKEQLALLRIRQGANLIYL